MTKAVEFALGETQTCAGTYLAHWEWSRFVTRQPRKRLPGTRQVLCDPVNNSGDSISPLDALSMDLPDNWRHRPPLRFAVIVRVTPIEEGRFGHMGTLRWRLRVDEWVDVRPETDP